MHRTGVIGLSWRHPRGWMLDALTIPREDRAERVARLAAAAGLRELVYIATCNRVEVAFAIEGSRPVSEFRRDIFAELVGRKPQAAEAEHTLRAWQGEGAAEHLFLVTSGLDSARVGENEVAVQVRDAVEQSRALGLVGVHLEPVFTEALKVAKRVRPVTQGHEGAVSLSDIALRHVFVRVERTGGCVALVGISPMTQRCARALVARGVPVVIVNRTLSRAEVLAVEIGGRAVSLDSFRQSPDAVDVVILATGAREPVLSRAELERIGARSASGESPLFVDLGVPANVRPEDAAAADVPRVGMEEITAEAAEDRQRALMEVSEARAIVDSALTDLCRAMAERMVGPVIGQLRLRYRHTALEGLERLFQRDLAGLGDAERDAVRRWGETLARRFAHIPSVGLRDLIVHSGPTAVEAFFSTTEPDLARAMRDASDRAGAELLASTGDET